MNSTPHTRTLNKALEVHGTKERLADALGVSLPELDAYLAGERRAPNRVFLEALDIVASRREP